MKTQYASSSYSDTLQATEEIARTLGHTNAKLLIYFASSKHDPQTVSKAMKRAFPDTPSIGCTTAGEIASGQMFDDSIVAMALGPELIKRVSIHPISDLSTDSRTAVANCFKTIEDDLGMAMSTLDPEHYVGLILADGLSGAEEEIMDAAGDATDISIVGGSAGDDLAFKQTHVYANHQALTNAAVIAVIETASPFEIIKTQSFKVLPQKLLATKVNAAKRQVLEFNGKPAIEAYAEALGVSTDEAPNRFMKNPTGLVVDQDVFVRSPQRFENGSLYFYCAIIEGMELSLLESTDIVADTQTAIEAVKNPSAIVNFNCILRTLELKQKQQCDAYGSLFSNIPTIGFSTYGEEYLGHINQTATMLAFRDAYTTSQKV